MSYLSQIPGRKNQSAQIIGAGLVGQYLNASNTSGTSVPSSGTAVNITTLSLTGGFWQVNGSASWTSANSGGPVYYCLSTSSATVTADLGRVGFFYDQATTYTTSYALPIQYVNVPSGSTTTVYLSAIFDTGGLYPSGGILGVGYITALRIV